MSMIISDILEWCQNDMEYLQELIDTLQNIVNDSSCEETTKNDVCACSISDLKEEFYDKESDE